MKEKSIVWLSGVRRIGKTMLCRQLEGVEYFNCDLPSTQRQLSDPEFFFHRHRPGTRIVLDEIHRLEDPSLFLKIAADEFPNLLLVATGSSTLAATRKFKDSLTGRKRSVHLPPVLWRESPHFGVVDLDRRLLLGGFPEMLLASSPDVSFFEEWIDSFYARDIQELFGVRKRVAFLSLLKLILLRSGGQLDISDLAKEIGISRPTVMSHLEAMEIAHTIFRVPPYHGASQREIISRPKSYGFDTGIIAHVRGWTAIRETDRGQLWEHLVLDELRRIYPPTAIHYWRDKSGREIDFVIDKGSGQVDTVESKIDPDKFEVTSLKAFRSLYPNGKDFLVCPYVKVPYHLQRGGRSVIVCNPEHMT